MGFSSTTSTGPLSLQVHSISNKAWTSIVIKNGHVRKKSDFFYQNGPLLKRVAR